MVASAPPPILVGIFIGFLAIDYLRPPALQALKLQMVFVALFPVVWLFSKQRAWSTVLTLEVCFIASGLVMLPFARNNFEVYYNARVMFSIFVTALATVWLMSHRKYFHRIAWSVAIIMCVQAVYAITHAGHGYGDMFGDENDLAAGCVIIFPLGYLGFELFEGRFRWLCGFLALLMAMAVVVSFSRGGFLGLAVAGAFCMLSGRNRIRNVTLGVIAATLFLLVVPSDYKEEMETIKDTDTGTAETRLFLWVTATRIWLDHPILGVGPGNTAGYIGEYQPRSPIAGMFGGLQFQDRDWTGKAVHSIYFEILSERGLVGIGLFAAVVVVHFRTLRRVRGARNLQNLPADLRRDAIFFSRVLGAAMAGFLAAGTFLSMAAYPYLWFLSAQACALERWVRSERSRTNRASRPSQLAPRRLAADTRS